jgi:DNA-binding transcriptional ArsR family regulator
LSKTPIPTNNIFNGFENLYPLLQTLTSGRADQSFFERITILMQLAELSTLITARELARQLNIPASTVSHHLSQLRDGGWFVEGDEKRYLLTPYARICLFALRIVAQPWDEALSSAVVTQLYEAAAATELGLGNDFQFSLVVSTMENSLERLQHALRLETSEVVKKRLLEAQITLPQAKRALELREQGVSNISNAEDYRQMDRVHRVISGLQTIMSRLETHYLQLLKRELLASGQVTLGDIKSWSREAGDEDRSSAIYPFMRVSAAPYIGIATARLPQSEQEISGRIHTKSLTKLPVPIDYETGPQTRIADEHLQLLITRVLELREKIDEENEINFGDWIQHDNWQEAAIRWIAALSPFLSRHGLILNLMPTAELISRNDGAVSLVSDGNIKRKDVADV